MKLFCTGCGKELTVSENATVKTYSRETGEELETKTKTYYRCPDYWQSQSASSPILLFSPLHDSIITEKSGDEERITSQFKS